MKLPYIVLGALAIALILTVSGMDRKDAVIQEKHNQENAEKKAGATLEDRYALVHPLPYDASVSQRGAGESWKTRYYVRSGK